MVGSKDLPPSHVPFFPNTFLKNQLRTKAQWPPHNTDLTDTVAVVTGGNSGLGFEAARQMLSFKLGQLILACRSLERGEAAANRLRVRYPKAKIEVWVLDMCSYDSIQAFARRTETQLSRLDIVLLNAGVMNAKYATVPSTGHEESVQVNYLSTALLTILLLPVLKSKARTGTPGRLTITNSGLAFRAKLPDSKGPTLLRTLDNPSGFDGNNQYCCSKLLAHMFLWKVVDYLSAADVIVNLADPGYVKDTGLMRDTSLLLKPAVALFAASFGRTVEMGASTQLDAMVVKGKESHGAYIMSYQIYPFNSVLYTPKGETITENLWQETLNELSFANVQGILDSLKRS